VRCTEFEELIMKELDGSLSERRAAELHAHLSTCARCRRSRDVLLGLDAALAEDVLRHAPSGLVAATMSRITAREARRRVTERVILWGAGATAAGFALASLVRVVRNAGVGSRLTTAVDRTVAAFPEPPLHNVETPGLLQQIAESPSVAGVLWTLAVVGSVFVAIQFLRTTRHLTFELR